MHPLLLELLRRSGVRSFVACAPPEPCQDSRLPGGDRGSRQCSEEDLHILLTIAGHVAAAIDNAKAYADLAELTQHLEERIEHRTEELSRANAQLQEHDRRRTTFLSVVSHELRTPMTAIRSFAENMLDGVTGPLTDLQHTYLTRIQHNVARLGRIIVQLLDWSRLDTKQYPASLGGSLHPSDRHNRGRQLADGRRREKRVPRRSAGRVASTRSRRSRQIGTNSVESHRECHQIHAAGRSSDRGVLRIAAGVRPNMRRRYRLRDRLRSHLPNIFDEFSRVPSAMPASQGAQLGSVHHQDTRHHAPWPDLGGEPAGGRITLLLHAPGRRATG